MSLENSINDLPNKVEKSEPCLVFCDWKECPELGQYIRCYFDLYQNCPKYINHQKHLNYIKDIKKEKRRHHPRR